MDDSEVLIPAPEVPGFYRVNRMQFHLDRAGQWKALMYDGWESCAWGYIEQMLSVFEIELLMELAPQDLSDRDVVEAWLAS